MERGGDERQVPNVLSFRLFTTAVMFETLAFYSKKMIHSIEHVEHREG
jgi:hypothetical protein